MLKLLVATLLTIWSTLALAAFWSGQTYAPPPPPSQAQLQIGGGGWIHGLDVANDGTKFARPDGYGLYAANDAQTKWQQIITSATLPNGDPANSPAFCYNYNACTPYAEALFPSNGNIAYVIWGGYLYKTTNLENIFSGTAMSWNATSWPQCSTANCVAGNNNSDSQNDMMRVDPNSSASLLLGTTAGVYYTTDSGATRQGPVSGITAPASPYGIMVCYDTSAGTTGGLTNSVYAYSPGHGLYHTSTTVAGTWAAVAAGGPTTASAGKLICGPDGYVYIADVTATIKIWSGSAWITSGSITGGFSQSLSTVYTLALDPANPNYASNAHLVALVNGHPSFSINSGANWTGTETNGCIATDVPWLAWTNECTNFNLVTTYGSTWGGSMSDGDISYDPNLTNTIFYGEGIGVWKWNPVGTIAATASSSGSTLTVTVTSGVISTPAILYTGNSLNGRYIKSQLTGTTGSTGTYQLNGSATAGSGSITIAGMTWTDVTAGIENLTTTGVIAPNTPGACPVVFSWDRPEFKACNPTTAYPTVHGVANPQQYPLMPAFSADWASSSPGTIFAEANAGAQVPGSATAQEDGVSTDGGSTFTACGASPATNGQGAGWVAASTPSDLAYITGGGGSSPGVYMSSDGCGSWTAVSATGFSQGAGQNWYTYIRSMCADRVDTGVLYILNVNSTAGIYKWPTWTPSAGVLVHSGGLSGSFDNHLVCNPYTAGSMLYASGMGAINGGAGNPLYDCEDSLPGNNVSGGSTQVTCTSITSVQAIDVAFGVAKPGNSYPSIYVIGYVSSSFGLYACDNWQPGKTTGLVWRLLSAAPLGILEYVDTVSIDADKNKYDVVYISFFTGGWGVLQGL